ncbi:MAG: hypothetical protein ACRDH7_04770 [Actinomycetota bacterium]
MLRPATYGWKRDELQEPLAAVGRIADGSDGLTESIVSDPRLRGVGLGEGFLAGLLFGLLAGGLIGLLAVALVMAGSGRGPRAGRESSMRVDLLLDLHETDRYGMP